MFNIGEFVLVIELNMEGIVNVVVEIKLGEDMGWEMDRVFVLGCGVNVGGNILIKFDLFIRVDVDVYNDLLYGV